MESKNKQVAKKIIDILRNGLTLDADTLHYIDSTFSNPSIGELEKLLQDESSCETDSLLELLFFPDESVQLQLEDMLEDRQFQKQDEQIIQQMVCRKPIQTRIHFPDNGGTLGVRVTPLNVTQFIAHLNLLRCLNPKLAAAITDHVPATFQTKCKVKLRNARPLTSQSKIFFLQAFFEKLSGDSETFFDELDFILSFLEECKDASVMFQALMAKKRFYFQSLQKAKDLEIQLTKHNVETLMLRGKRLSYVDGADARKKIQMIDRISLAIFGKTEYFELPYGTAKRLELRSDQDMQKVIKILS